MAQTVTYKELRFREVMQITLICGNQVEPHITLNPTFLEKTKHIKIVYHLI